MLECLLIGHLLVPRVHHILGKELLLKRNHLLFVHQLLVVVSAQSLTLTNLVALFTGFPRAEKLSLNFESFL
jgi:hypothetical protein